MAHLVYSYGSWDRVEPPWEESCVCRESGVSPQAGDTFSDFTSGTGAAADIQRRDLDVVVLRTAMWGENDYRIIPKGEG